MDHERFFVLFLDVTTRKSLVCNNSFSTSSFLLQINNGFVTKNKSVSKQLCETCKDGGEFATPIMFPCKSIVN